MISVGTKNTQPYSYADSGFNMFLNRSIGSTIGASLGDMASSFRKVNQQSINFDNAPTTGALGDKIQVGEIEIDGAGRKISFFDDGHQNEIGRIGELDG